MKRFSIFIAVGVLFALAHVLFSRDSLEIVAKKPIIEAKLNTVLKKVVAPFHGPNLENKSKISTKPHQVYSNGREHTAAYINDGWKVVAAQPLDQNLLALDPALLIGREQDLRQQLETTRVSPANIDNAAIIALHASEPRTRAAVIDSIGHRKLGEGGEVMMYLFEGLGEEQEKSHALRYIRANSLESEEAEWLITQLFASHLSSSIKSQIIRNLALTGVMQHHGKLVFVPELLARVPVEWRSEMQLILAPLVKPKFGS